MGVGAFNRQKRCLRGGTHRAIRMRPDDDMKLAKLLKSHGFRQGVACRAGLISVEWHQTLPDAVRGLSKSMFSGLDYRIGATLAGVLMLLLTNVLPVFGLFSRNSMGTLCRSNIFWTFLLYAYRARHFGNETPWWYAMLHPFGICVFIYAMLRSASTTLVRGGIEWHTRYLLKDLKDDASERGPPQPLTQKESSARQGVDAALFHSCLGSTQSRSALQNANLCPGSVVVGSLKLTTPPSLSSPGFICQPVQGDGRGPRLFGRAEMFAGEGIEILAKTATNDLL